MSKLAMHGWKNFLTETRKSGGHPKILRELDEDEYENIRGVLQDIDPKKLPMNDMFGGKFRKVIPISAYGGDIGALQDFITYMGYKIDFKKGTASKTISKEYGGKVREKKVEVKINKLLKNVLREREKLDELKKEHFAARDAFFDNPQNCAGKDKDGYAKSDSGECKEALDKMKAASDAVLEQNDKIRSLYNNPATSANPNVYRGFAPNGLRALMKTWQENATYFKNLEPGGVDEKADEYSIIVSRHPIDVLRMADYEDIQSCHSPPTRGGESEYWKCAIAEAIDGGAVAYLVNTNELKDMEEEMGKKVEDVAGEEEVFYDDYRRTGIITPLSRLRLRLLQNTTDPGNNDSYLAVPEVGGRVYGKKVPSFDTTVREWAAEKQKKAIAAIPKDDNGKYNVNKLTMVGGTHLDTAGNTLLGKLLGVNPIEAFVPFSRTKVSGETENALSDVTDAADRMHEAVDEQLREYNSIMDYAKVGGEVEDYGDGPFISAWGSAYYTIESTELSPEELDRINNATRESLDQLAEVYRKHLEGGGAAWASAGWGGNESSLHIHGAPTLGKNAKQIVWTHSINSGDEFGFTDVHDVDSFEYFCGEIKRDINDPFDDNGPYKKIFKAVLTKGNLLKGSGLSPFGWEIDSKTNEELNKYLDVWTVDVESTMGVVEKVNLTTPAYYVRGLEAVKGVPEKLDLEEILTIVKSKEFKHNLKVVLLQQAKNFAIGQHVIPYDSFMLAYESQGTADIAFEFTFEISEDDAKLDHGLVDSARRILTSFESKDEIKDIIEAAFVKTAIQFTGLRGAGLIARTDPSQQAMKFPATSIQSRRDGAGVNYQESRRALTTESLVKNWKKFLGK